MTVYAVEWSRQGFGVLHVDAVDRQDAEDQVRAQNPGSDSASLTIQVEMIHMEEELEA